MGYGTCVVLGDVGKWCGIGVGKWVGGFGAEKMGCLGRGKAKHGYGNGSDFGLAKG